MKRMALRFLRGCLFLLPAASVGCAALGPNRNYTVSETSSLSRPVGQNRLPLETSTLQQASLQAPVDTAVSSEKIHGTALLFEGHSELRVELLVEQVLARNPTLSQMTAAWVAASARYPQVTALDDPMFGAFIGPSSISSKDVNFAYRFEASQRIPFCGKLPLRGQGALAEAAAAGNEVNDTRLQLIESAKNAFYDYYLVHRALAVNQENLQLLKELRSIAEERYKANQSPQQDLLQSDVEIGRQRERTLALERMRKVAQARLNTLMHLPPDSPLPPPPQQLELAAALPAVSALRSQALAQRPDLQALTNRIEAERAALGLAYREYYPDFEVMAAYDAFWQPEEKDLRTQIGVRMNLPVQLSRREGAVAEAQARLMQRNADLASRTDQVKLQVQEAYEQVQESERVVRLYNETILPSATENVRAARQAYVTNRVPFLSLIEAQRQLVELRDRYFEAMAEYHRRRATLERVTGTPLVTAP